MALSRLRSGQRAIFNSLFLHAVTKNRHHLLTMKPDWHDRPTEPGLWLVHAKGSRTDVMACTIVTDEMMACIDEAIDADIDYCGPYALPPDTKEEK